MKNYPPETYGTNDFIISTMYIWRGLFQIRSRFLSLEPQKSLTLRAFLFINFLHGPDFRFHACRGRF